MPDPLPTESQREALSELIAFALVKIRQHCREGNVEQAEELADAFHNIPREMYGWGLFQWNAFRGMLEVYEAKYHEDDGPFTKRLDEIRKIV